MYSSLRSRALYLPPFLRGIQVVIGQRRRRRAAAGQNAHIDYLIQLAPGPSRHYSHGHHHRRSLVMVLPEIYLDPWEAYDAIRPLALFVR